MTAKKEPIFAFDLDLQTKWKNIAGVRQRHPRTGYEEVVELVNATWPPTIFMREHEKTTDIVIRFERSSRQLPDGHREVYFDNFVPLTRVFEDVISNAPAKGENTIRWKLVTEAYRAYQLTWLRLFRVQFQNQIYPAKNPPKFVSDMEKIFKSERPPGRHRKIDSDQLRRRLHLLLEHAERLHRIIKDHLANKPVENRGHSADVIRSFWRSILKIPGGISILGGEAFMAIPYRKQGGQAKLEDPTTWKPRQLAITLLAIETEQQYHTIERKFPLHKRPKR